MKTLLWTKKWNQNIHTPVPCKYVKTKQKSPICVLDRLCWWTNSLHDMFGQDVTLTYMKIHHLATSSAFDQRLFHSVSERDGDGVSLCVCVCVCVCVCEGGGRRRRQWLECWMYMKIRSAIKQARCQHHSTVLKARHVPSCTLTSAGKMQSLRNVVSTLSMLQAWKYHIQAYTTLCKHNTGI